jgi:hypothetical protein
MQFDSNKSIQSPKNLIEVSKMRKLEDARRLWLNQHQTDGQSFNPPRLSSNQSHFSDDSSSHFKMLAFNRKNNVKSPAQTDLKGRFQELSSANQTMSTFNKSNIVAPKNKSTTKVLMRDELKG